MAGETVYLGSPASTNQIIFAAQNLTASTSGANIPGMEKYTSALFYLTIGAVGGSTPLIDVYIQTLLPDATTWQDIAHFTQVTSSTVSEIIHFVTGASSVAAVQTEALASATIKAIGLGHTIRVRVKMAGTSPTAASTTVYASFYE